MPSATVIDQLIVKLGLDPKDFDKGRKRAAAEVVSLEKDVKRSTGEMSRSVVGFTGKLLGVATAAVAVKKSLSYVSDISKTVRQMGNDSKAWGIAASEMRNFFNISEMMGGSAEESRKSIEGITKAVYNLAYNGQVSDSLIMLGRMGVKFQTTTGEARKFRDIVLDAETQIQRLMKSGTSYENANQMLLQAGFDQGLVRAMLEGNVAQQLAQQEQRRQVTPDIVAASTDWEKSATNRDQAIAAATLRVLPAQAAAGIAGNKAIADAAEYASDATLEGTLEDIGRMFEEGKEKLKQGLDVITDWVGDKADSLRMGMWSKGQQHYEGTIAEAAKRHGIDPRVLSGLLSTESNFNPAAVNPTTGARGIAQLLPKYFPNAGKNPHEDIFTAAGELRRLKDLFQERQGMNEDDAYHSALQAYNAGRSRVLGAMSGGKPLAQETLDYPGKVLDYAASPTPGAASGGSAGGSNQTEVNIGRVDIHTRATDADGIATDFAGATSRKMKAAQADSGVS